MIPVNQGGSNQFSLKPYNEPCCLTCMKTEKVIKAVVREGNADEADSSYKLVTK